MNGPSAGITARPPSERLAALEDLIRRDRISMVFQPIVDLSTGCVAGYEALTRPDRSTVFAHAGEVFEVAEGLQRFEALEALTRRKALEVLAAHPVTELIFLNNSAPVFMADGYVERIIAEIDAAAAHLPPHRLVLEITEHTAQGLIGSLGRRSRELQELGFNVALDDVGAGISGLNQIMALRPNWMKLDIELIADIDVDPLKQNLIRFFVHFAKLSSMKVVAEGIERDEELRVLIELGVGYGQGFYLGEPGRLGAGIDPAVHERIAALRGHAEARRRRDPGMVRAAALATPAITCDITDSIDRVAKRLDRHVHGRGVVVQDGRRCVGWLDRGPIEAAAAAGSRGRVATLPIGEGPVLGSDFTLAEAMEIVAALPREQQTLPLIVQDQGRVVGQVSLRRLLLAAADVQRGAPSHLALLTGIPGRQQADRWIAGRIKAGDPADIAFVDLRDFDAFNLAHGFEKGDEMLLRVVGLIRRQLIGVAGGASFFAHLGEDRFVLALPGGMESRLLDLVDAFAAVRGEFFSSADLAAGTYCCDDASGRTRTHPLTTLRIIHLPGALLHVADPRALHQAAASLRLRAYDPTADARRLITDERTRGGARQRESA